MDEHARDGLWRDEFVLRYLYQQIVLALCSGPCLRRRWLSNSRFVCAVVVALASLSYVCVERPFLLLKDRLAAHRVQRAKGQCEPVRPAKDMT